LTTTIGQLKLEHHAGLKNCADELWKLDRANTTLQLLTQKSEINLMYISTSLPITSHAVRKKKTA